MGILPESNLLIGAAGSEEEVFDNIMADKTVSENPREKEVAAAKEAEEADEEQKSAEKAKEDELRINDPGPSSPRLYLAILFFLKNYNGSLYNLPGVEKDEKELKEVLKNYQQKVINSSRNVLDDLKEISEDCKQKKFERIHFHFSGEQYSYKPSIIFSLHFQNSESFIRSRQRCCQSSDY